MLTLHVTQIMIEGPLTAAFVTSAAAVLTPKACVHDFLCLMFRDELQMITARSSGQWPLSPSNQPSRAVADSRFRLFYSRAFFAFCTSLTLFPFCFSRCRLRLLPRGRRCFRCYDQDQSTALTACRRRRRRRRRLPLIRVSLQDLDVYNVDDERLCVSQKPAFTDEKPFHDKVRLLLETASDASRLAVMPSHWQPWL
jgi:hypothetical protein